MNGPFKQHKILAHLPILTDYILGSTEYPPILVEIDLTNLCASACPWCAGYLDRKWSNATLFADGASPSERLENSVHGVKNLISELKHLGVQAITWTGGGDPTQHKGLQEIVEFASYAGLKQALITHGVIDVSKLIHHFEWVRFSVDASTVEGYRDQHGKPQHFAKVLENITKAANRKRDENLEVTVGVGFLTHFESWKEIETFPNLWKDVPVDYIQYRPLHDTHGKQWESDTDTVIGLIAKAKAIDSRVTCSEVKYKAIANGEPGRTKNCHGIYFESAISADGMVYTCCHHKGNLNFAIGDLETDTFTKIWKKHLGTRFIVSEDCPSFCRHFGTNQFIEDSILVPRIHKEFI
jgi:MoaA/NifB/PqqE/SkfB family radical SAM enzyme